jgi:hypothetical protein
MAEAKEMNQQHRQWRRVVVRIAAGLLIIVIIAILVGRWSSLLVRADNASQSVVDGQPSSKLTDAITVALNIAKARGLLGDPEDIQVAKGMYSELMPPGTADSADKDRSVLLVEIKAKFLLNWPGVSNMPANYLYIYIDEKTGMPFENLAWTQSIPSLDQKTWLKVSKNDTDKFPIPDYAANQAVGVNFVGPTPTRVPVP